MTAQRVIDTIISGNLVHAECAHNEHHNCILVWSSGAVEQIEAVLELAYDPEISDLRGDLDIARMDARSLADCIYKKFYKEEAPEFVLADDLRGLISQIDNMVAGLVREPK